SLPRAALPKQLLRDAVPDLPDAIRMRRAKQGFSFPFGAWFSGPLRSRLGEVVHMAADEMRPFLRPDACDRLLAAFDAGKTHWSKPWALAALTVTSPSRLSIPTIPSFVDVT